MTKTTNYEISKKLKEIGFDKETNFYFTEVAPDKFEAQYYTNNKEYLLLKSYELETLFDVLPKKTEIIISQLTNKREFYLDYGSRGDEISVEIKENESLADTAGKMIIELYENNLIKF